MVTAVSGSTEQVGNMFEGIPKHNCHPSTPSQFHLASKSYHRHLSATQHISVHMHPSAGYYLVQNLFKQIHVQVWPFLSILTVSVSVKNGSILQDSLAKCVEKAKGNYR